MIKEEIERRFEKENRLVYLFFFYFFNKKCLFNCTRGNYLPCKKKKKVIQLQYEKKIKRM